MNGHVKRPFSFYYNFRYKSLPKIIQYYCIIFGLYTIYQWSCRRTFHQPRYCINHAKLSTPFTGTVKKKFCRGWTDPRHRDKKTFRFYVFLSWRRFRETPSEIGASSLMYWVSRKLMALKPNNPFFRYPAQDCICPAGTVDTCRGTTLYYLVSRYP